MEDGDVEDGIRLAPWNTSVGSAKMGIASYSTGRGQRGISGMVAERAFVAERFARVNLTFDDEVGLPCRSLVRRQAFGKNSFQFGQKVFKARPIW